MASPIDEEDIKIRRLKKMAECEAYMAETAKETKRMQLGRTTRGQAVKQMDATDSKESRSYHQAILSKL